MAAAWSPCGGFKTRVLHFKVKNTPLKDKNGKRKFKRILRFLFVEERKIFIEMVLRGIQPCSLHGGTHGLFWNATKAAKFLLNFQVHCPPPPPPQKKYIQNAPLFEMDFVLNLPCAQPILLAWTDPRSRFSSRWNAWSVLKCNQGSEVFAQFSGTLSPSPPPPKKIYTKCALIWNGFCVEFAMCSADFTCVNGSTV